MEYLFPKKELYSNLNMEDITDKNYDYAKKSLERIWNKNLQFFTEYLKLFYVLAKSKLTTSEIQLDYYNQKFNV